MWSVRREIQNEAQVLDFFSQVHGRVLHLHKEFKKSNLTWRVEGRGERSQCANSITLSLVSLQPVLEWWPCSHT